MFDPAEALRDNPALFACYVLFVYFRGVNAVRIEREMRALGYTTFHRRNLYPRGHQPGWIAKHNWSADTPVRMSVASTRKDGAESSESSIGQDGFAASGDADRSVRTPPDFHAWLKRVSPTMTWDWKHQQVIIEQLRKVTTGDCKRLMIFLPPRHGKSELVSVRYTAWRMQQDPSMNVILGSYNQRLADRMSRKIRTVVCDAEAIRLDKGGNPTGREGVSVGFKQDTQDGKNSKPNADHPLHPVHPVPIPSDQGSPFPFSRPRPKNAVSEWETAMGGSFRAVGAGSGVTGFGANLIVIDDPVKNRAQAESETYRNRVWDWYKDDLYTRLEPDGSIVLIQTRWHEDDLAGRLLRENLDDWTIINLPALSERSADTPVRSADTPVRMSVASTRKQSAETTDSSIRSDSFAGGTGDADKSVRTPSFEWRTAPDIALCPERFDIEALDKLKTQLGTYSFSALYQQRPTPAGGQIFKREWFKQIIDFAPPGLKWTRGYDLAVSTRTESDYTASFRCAFDKQGNLYIAGGFRRRIEFPEQRRYIIDRITHERDTQHGVELALHGQALLQDLRRDPALRGRSLRGVKVSTDKLTRALTWSPLAEEGKVILVRSADTPVRMSVASTRRKDVNDPDSSIGHNSFAGGTGDADKSVCAPSDWISNLLDELTAFPNATHDDQIDAISIAVHMHSSKPRTATGMLIT